MKKFFLEWGNGIIALVALFTLFSFLVGLFVNPLKEDLKEIKNNHLAHIEKRLDKVEERLGNLEKGQAKIETSLEYIKDKLDKK